MATIFLSYAKEDKWYVDDVYRAIKAAGLSPWMDKPPAPYERDGIPPGAAWDDEIRKRLQTARVVLIFLSSVSIAKQGYVQREYRLALNEMMNKPSGQVYPIPVLIEPCEVPDVRVDTIRLKDFQWFELYSRGIDELVEYLAEIAPAVGQGVPAPSVRTVAEYNRDTLWDSDLASVNGLLVVYMAALSKQKRVAIIPEEVFERLRMVTYDYTYGFLVALRAARLVDYRTDWKSYWAFDYVHPALTKDFKASLRRRVQQLLVDEKMEPGQFSFYEADMRTIEDYIEERVIAENAERSSRGSRNVAPRTKRAGIADDVKESTTGAVNPATRKPVAKAKKSVTKTGRGRPKKDD